ncbi:unnamed protein product [marine sediment metagenome]|uniref:Uncharacterized protein n=1 Tax=marine sediment metagenome TaxID=412755 RepID=X1CDZ8_9ZZZZ
MEKENKYHKGLAVASWVYFILFELVLLLNLGMNVIDKHQFLHFNFPIGGVMLVLAIYYTVKIKSLK